MTDTRHKGVFAAFFFMELFWLFAWTDFLLKSTARILVPVIPFMAAYFFPFALASGFRGKNLRYIWVILGHAAAALPIAAVALWWGTGMIFPPGASVFQWYRFILMLLLAGLFWYKGTKLAFRQMSYKMVCNYFDLGLSLFFALLLVKLLIFYQSGVRLADAFLLYLMAGYFFSGLFAVFLSNAPTTRKKQYVEGFRGIGVLISFCMAFLLCGTGLVFVLMPLMTSMAESGYTVLKGVSGSLSPYLISLLRFILIVPKHRGEGAAASQDQGMRDLHHIGMTGEAGWVSDLVFYGFLLVMGAVALVLLGILILRVFKFLMQKPLSGPVAAGNTHAFRLWVRSILDTIQNFFKKIAFLFLSRIETGQAGFLRLTAWGRKSGVKRHRTETPGEYAKRLQEIFLPLENEIRIIIHAFHLETYGELKLDSPEIARMTEALKRIHSPSFWFMRIKAGIKRV